MIDLNKTALEVYSNTVRLGYTVSKHTTVSKLNEETEEFEEADKLGSDIISAIVSNLQCDADFLLSYEQGIKGSEQDEIPDLIMVLMSYCVANDIDLETCFMNKLRYNRLRSKK